MSALRDPSARTPQNSFWAGALWVACAVFALTACGGHRLIKSNFYQGKHSVVWLTQEDTPNGSIAKKDFRHPAAVSTEDISKTMRSLFYADPLFLWKEKERPIFSDAEIEILAPELSRALGTATSDQMIEFEIETWKKDLVFGSEKLTSGFLFIDPKGLNWVFGNLNLAQGQEGDRFNTNPMYSVPKNVRIALQTGQTYYRPEHRSWYEPKEYPNWTYYAPPFEVVAAAAPAAGAVSTAKTSAPPAKMPMPKAAEVMENMDATVKSSSPEVTKPAREKRMEPAPPTTPQVAQQAEDDISKRLRRLKALRDEKLISEKEYEQKKQEILKNL